VRNLIGQRHILTTTAIPISLSFDVEPDLRCIDPSKRTPWAGFEDLCLNRLAGYRELLSKASGSPARFCWNLRLDPQIQHTYGSADWAVQRYRGILDSLQSAGDEIGLHTHCWRWAPETNAWIADFENAEWVEHCLRLSFETYKACFGKPPRVFSHGDRFMSNRVLELLEELGVECDVTMEPGRVRVRRLVDSESATGWIPHYKRMPRRPYQPSPKNFRKPGRHRKRNIWILPVSTGAVRRFSGECESMLLGYPFTAIRKFFDQNLERDNPYILTIARTDVTLKPVDREHLETFLQYLAEHPLRRRFAFVPPIETLRYLTRSDK
jgi:hypothetical protein